MSASKFYFIDANVFLRVFIKDDGPAFINCVKFFELVKTGKILAVTSSIAVAEVVWVMLSFYKLPKDVVIEAIGGIVNMHGLTIMDRVDHLLALTLYKTHGVKYTDCLIVSSFFQEKEKWVMVSYDKDFDKLKIKRATPDSICA